MDAEDIKKWKPIALLLLGASLISATTVYSGAFAKLSDWLNPSPEFQVLVGYIHGNGQDQDSVLPTIEDSDGKIVFIDARINMSRATRPTELFTDHCNGTEMISQNGKTVISGTVGGSVEQYGSDKPDFGIKCGDISIEISLLSPPKEVRASLGVFFYMFSGLFEVKIYYSGLDIARYTLREIELPPRELSVLRAYAEERWREIPHAV